MDLFFLLSIYYIMGKKLTRSSIKSKRSSKSCASKRSSKSCASKRTIKRTGKRISKRNSTRRSNYRRIKKGGNDGDDGGGDKPLTQVQRTMVNLKKDEEQMNEIRSKRGRDAVAAAGLHNYLSGFSTLGIDDH